MTGNKLLSAALIVLHVGAATLDADLIGYWPFDEVFEVAGVRMTPDASGNGHDGVLSDTVKQTEEGFVGGAADFGAFDNRAVVELPTFPQDDRPGPK